MSYHAMKITRSFAGACGHKESELTDPRTEPTITPPSSALPQRLSVTSDGEFQYEIMSAVEGHNRPARESELTRRG